MCVGVAKRREEKKPKNHNRLLRLVSAVLLVLVAVLFVRSRIELSRKNQQLEAIQAQIVRQELKNREVRLLLDDKDRYVDQEARQDYDYADPEEKVFVVVP